MSRLVPGVLAAEVAWSGPGAQSEALELGGVPRRAGANRRPLLLAELGARTPFDPRLDREARRLVVELIDDDVSYNAMQAAWRLRELGPAAIPALRDALLTRDKQQRMYVVSLLSELGAAIDGDLLRAALANLEEDDLHGSQLSDDTESTRLMIRGGERSWPMAQAGLRSRDRQRRFLSAVVLARTRCPGRIELTITVLVGHLRDNPWKNDAAIASRALFHLGDAALPHLRRLRGMPGPQARKLLALLISELESPSRTPDEAYVRARRMAPDANGRPLTVWRFNRDPYYGLVGG